MSTSSGEERELLARLRALRSQARDVEDKLVELQSQELAIGPKPTGAAAAAIIAASIGIFAIGLLTTLAAANVSIKSWLDWYTPTGPLSGKTTLGGIIWLVVWVAGHYLLRQRDLPLTRVAKVSAALLVLGLLLMFPPIFETFE